MSDPLILWFWDESFWLGGRLTWQQIESAGYRHFDDIYLAVHSVAAWLIIRIILERHVFVALCNWIGVTEKPQENSVLEKCFRRFNGNIPHNKIDELAKKVKQTKWDIERWIQLRVMEECSTLTSKFAQAAWKFCAYTFIFLYGLNAMWDEPCLWDSEQCFIGYPKHYVSDKIWWYYNLQIGLYISFFIWHFFADKQKDFRTMALNYIVMLGYLIQTWSINLTLIGSFTMLIHDVVGIFIELAKCLAFMNKHFYSHITVGVFSFLWVLTRFIIFPYRVLYYTLYESVTVLPFVPGYYIQFVFLYSMLILSGVLTIVVLQTTHYKFTTGAVNLF